MSTTDEILSYEEVSLYYPRANIKVGFSQPLIIYFLISNEIPVELHWV